MARPQTVVIFFPCVICADFLCDGYFYLFVYRYVPTSGAAKIMYRTACWFLEIFKNRRDVIHTSLIFFSVLRIWDVYPGSEFFPSRIRIKEFMYFSPKNCFYALGNMIRVVHPGSQIRILIILPIPDPQHCFSCIRWKTKLFSTSRTRILKLHLYFKVTVAPD